jgi:hypothetical protein
MTYMRFERDISHIHVYSVTITPSRSVKTIRRLRIFRFSNSKIMISLYLVHRKQTNVKLATSEQSHKFHVESPQVK